jgi:hypothetical protein
LRALRYFASFAFNVSLFLERIPFAQSSQRTAKLTAAGWFLRRAAPTRYDARYWFILSKRPEKNTLFEPPSFSHIYSNSQTAGLTISPISSTLVAL